MSIAIAQQLKSGVTKEVQQSVVAGTDEFIAFCPKCKTLEILWFDNGYLMQTRKFAQNLSKETRHEFIKLAIKEAG